MVVRDHAELIAKNHGSINPIFVADSKAFWAKDWPEHLLARFGFWTEYRGRCDLAFKIRRDSSYSAEAKHAWCKIAKDVERATTEVLTASFEPRARM